MKKLNKKLLGEAKKRYSRKLEYELAPNFFLKSPFFV